MGKLGDFTDRNDYSSDHIDKGQSRVPIQNSIIYLLIHQHRIRNVGEWSASMGYSRSHFSREMKAFYDESPKKLFRTIKAIKIFIFFSKDPACKAFVIARDTAFENEKTLGQFLTRNFNMTIKDVRNTCDKESLASLKLLLDAETPMLIEYWVELIQIQQQYISYFLEQHKKRTERC